MNSELGGGAACRGGVHALALLLIVTVASFAASSIALADDTE